MPLQTIQLGNGVEVPVVAFGTGTDHAFGDCSTAVTRALRAGLTHLDCAWWYKNQHHIARVLPARHEIFITSKIGDFHGDAENFDANKYVDECLAELGVEYIDLVLLHADILVSDPVLAWKQLEAVHRQGKARSIGLSNFTCRNLRRILASCEVCPAVHQIELHPYSLPHYTELLPLCKEARITVACYAPLLSLGRHRGGPVDGIVERIAAETGLTDAQVLLCWARQISLGIVVSTTTQVERMKDMFEVFDTKAAGLAPEQVEAITVAGAKAPYRNWGAKWPYFMQGEGGVQACPEGSSHRVLLSDSRAHLK